MSLNIKKLMLATAMVAAPLMVATTASAEGEKYILVSHAPDSDSWWNTIKNGIALAGTQMGVEVEYRNPPTGDLADMARIIDQAAASSPDGIITTFAGICGNPGTYRIYASRMAPDLPPAISAVRREFKCARFGAF